LILCRIGSDPIRTAGDTQLNAPCSMDNANFGTS